MAKPFSENSFLKKLFPLLPTGKNVIVPAGDDCAVIEVGGKLLALSVDQLIENRHYLPESGPFKAGRKLLTRNLSDLAAMGAQPLYALISSATGPDKDEEWLEEFHRGILSAAKIYNVLILGGDLAVTPNDTLASLTIIGELEKKPILRSGALAGHSIYVTGEFGNSFLSEHHLNFEPRIHEGQWLAEHASAMIDITDGVLTDLLRVSAASGVGAVLFPEQVPARDQASIKQRMCDGEDYELLFAIDQKDEKKLEKDWPFSCSLTKIGNFCAEIDPGKAVDKEGTDLTQIYGLGFDHFQ